MWKIILALLIASLILLALPPSTSSYTALESPLSIKEYAEKRVIETFGGGWAEFERIIAKESHNWTVLDAHYPSGYANVKQKDGTYKKVKSSAWGLCGTLVNSHKVAED